MKRVRVSTDNFVRVRTAIITTVAGGGNVVGPPSAVDSNFASFDTTTGELIKDSGSKPSDITSKMSKQSLTDNALTKANGTGGEVQDTGIIVSDNDGVSGAGTTFNKQTGTSYTMVLADAGKTIIRTNAAASTHTIPDNASVAFKEETVIGIMNEGTGTVTVGITSDTLNQKDSTFDLAAGCQASLTKTAATVWRLTGELS